VKKELSVRLQRNFEKEVFETLDPVLTIGIEWKIGAKTQERGDALLEMAKKTYTAEAKKGYRKWDRKKTIKNYKR